MPSWPPETLAQALALAAPAASASLGDGRRRVGLREAFEGSCLGHAARELAGKSVAVAVASQFEAALTLIELDGLARRMVLLPPDVRPEHLDAIIRDAGVEAVVCSDAAAFQHLGVSRIVTCGTEPAPRSAAVPATLATEWLMLTSGTTGDPKIAIHTLKGLTGAIAPLDINAPRPVWSTFYDIRRYGGLQIFLRAMLCGGSLVLSDPHEAVADHLARLRREGVTHISGTPTHWRRALMSGVIAGFSPAYVRLSGEIADQPVLDALRAVFPGASVGHAYASTEAGVGFDVNDGLEGFPASYLEAPRQGVEMQIADGSLRVRSDRMAHGYAGRPNLVMADTDGWIDTGDMVEVRHGRCHFTGRRGGIINVGGLKVHPEEIETVLNRHDAVRQSRVKPRKSPVIGAIVVADVVLRETTQDVDSVKLDILALCRSSLPAHKIPAILNVVAAIEMTAGGKVSRQHA